MLIYFEILYQKATKYIDNLCTSDNLFEVPGNKVKNT